MSRTVLFRCSWAATLSHRSVALGLDLLLRLKEYKGTRQRASGSCNWLLRRNGSLLKRIIPRRLPELLSFKALLLTDAILRKLVHERARVQIGV